jgi:hypothetical protein
MNIQDQRNRILKRLYNQSIHTSDLKTSQEEYDKIDISKYLVRLEETGCPVTNIVMVFSATS